MSDEPTMTAHEEPRAMSEERPARPIVDSRTLVPIGAIGALTILLLSAKTWLDGQFDAVRSNVTADVTKLSADLVELRYEIRDLKASGADRWTASDQRLWAERLRATNPGLTIPPTDPNR